MSLDSFLQDGEILICAGSGGVGKTTTAAAIALEAARAGKKALVLTIDPARRLASALGLKELGNVQTRIRPALFEQAGIQVEGELWGMMLDMKRTWDDLIERIAPTPERRDKILGNQYYQSLSSALAGSQEYMAMEKLLEIHSAGEFDLIVVDTPPTKHALDFLEAPRRMSDFLEGKVIQAFLKPYAYAGKTGFKLLQRGTATVMSVVEKVTGVEVMRDLADFFLSFDGLYDGFKSRALAVNQLLRSRRTSFFLVASPSNLILQETAFFGEKLIEFKMPLGAIVFNRVHTCTGADAKALRAVERLVEKPDKRKEIASAFGDEADTYDEVLRNLLVNFLRTQKLGHADEAAIRRFLARYSGIETCRVPVFDEDIHDIAGLARLAPYLFESGS